jgi:hypothetical protein
MLSSLEDGVNALEDDPSQITTEEGPEGFQNASEIAGELGLKECGQ